MGHTCTRQTRRRTFLAQASALGAASLFGIPSELRAEPPPETKRIRLATDEVICLAPQFLAEDLLRMEGFSEIEYVRQNYDKYPTGVSTVAANEADFTQDAAINLVPLLDARQPLVALSGVHVGCWELFGGSRVRSIRDLKGKRVPVASIGAEEHLLASSIMAYLGMDPRKDVEFVTLPLDGWVKAFTQGSVDAIFAYPPQPQELRAQKIGHVIVDSSTDRPWSQYFCCMAVANREFATRYPVATKRALRAFLKAADICAQDPQRVARYLVAKGHEQRYETALEVLSSIPFGRWRLDNPEDTLRFHALRLHEVGMIKTSPNKLIAQGTDWRLLNELKKEMKS